MIAALLELQFAEPDRVKQFNCDKCDAKVKKLRKCDSDRWDYTVEDGNLWPIFIQKNGEGFGFCPAKATKDIRLVMWFNSLRITAETGKMHFSGPLEDQPSWYLELLGYFLYCYNEYRFYSRAKAILGDGKSTGASKNGNNQGTTRSKNNR